MIANNDQSPTWARIATFLTFAIGGLVVTVMHSRQSWVFTAGVVLATLVVAGVMRFLGSRFGA